MVPKLAWDDSYRPDRGKVLSAEELEGVKTFYRYLDADGDGIAARTLPGISPRARSSPAAPGTIASAPIPRTATSTST